MSWHADPHRSGARPPETHNPTGPDPTPTPTTYSYHRGQRTYNPPHTNYEHAPDTSQYDIPHPGHMHAPLTGNPPVAPYPAYSNTYVNYPHPYRNVEPETPTYPQEWSRDRDARYEVFMTTQTCHTAESHPTQTAITLRIHLCARTLA